MWNCVVGFGVVLLLQDAAPGPTANPAATPLPAAQEGGFGSLLWLIVGIGIGIVIGALLSKAFGKSHSETDEKDISQLSIYTPPRPAVVPGSITPNAKRCPKCNSTYTDEALIYCVSDGASLVSVNNPLGSDPNATMLYRDSTK